MDGWGSDLYCCVYLMHCVEVRSSHSDRLCSHSQSPLASKVVHLVPSRPWLWPGCGWPTKAWNPKGGRRWNHFVGGANWKRKFRQSSIEVKGGKSKKTGWTPTQAGGPSHRICFVKKLVFVQNRNVRRIPSLLFWCPRDCRGDEELYD